MLSRISVRFSDSTVGSLARASASRGAWVVVGLFILAVAAALGYERVSRARASDPLAGRTPDVMTFASEGERLTDGVIAAEGAPWNCRYTALVLAGGGIEWDLGRESTIARAFLQADNDDLYAVLVSRDRQVWEVLWEALPTRVPGLSSRHSATLDARARYVRLEPRAGDGNYAVSELRLSSDREGPWPPPLEARPGGEPEVRGEFERRLLSGAAFLLAAAGLSLTGSRRRAAQGYAVRPLLWTTVLASAGFIATALAYSWKHRHNVVDDSYISLQYAKNWISNQGLVFNPGERVEGFTNFLWTALLAPLWPLSGHDPLQMTRAATWLALGFAVAGIWLVYAIGRRGFSKAPYATAFAVLLLCCDDSYVAYPVVFALENQLLVTLMLGGTYLFLVRPKHWEPLLGASFGLVAMTRPDGLLWAGAFFLAQLASRWSFPARREVPLEFRPLGVVFGTFVALTGAYFCARHGYYGEPLPNTFHLKVGSTLDGLERGLDYLRGYVSERAGLPLLALGAVLLSRSIWVRWLVAHALLHAAYVAYVGGDFYAGHRFLLVLAPSVALLTAVVFARVLQALPAVGVQRLALAVGVVLCVAVRYGTLQHGPFVTDLYGSTPTVDNNVQYMRWLREVARPASSMVVGDIGATGLFADVRVIDYFGVVDKAVARKHVPEFGRGKAGHEKVLTREEQLARNPTYIKWGYVDDSRRPTGYYIFNDFPLHLRVEGLWVRDDLARGRSLPGARFGFSPGELTAWTGSEELLGAQPATAANPGQMYANGQFGSFINTFTPAGGDRATGWLLSPAFELSADFIRLLVGGGRDPERLRVSLLVEGRRVFSETGTNWETLGRREWDIRSLRGKSGRIEIVDQAVGAWGHLMVDEIEQWAGTSSYGEKL